MTEAVQTAEISLYRLPRTLAVTGFSRSMLYARINRGVFPRPVRLGRQAIVWPSDEVAALVQALVAGATEAQLTKLVKKLHAKRTEGAPPRLPAASFA